MNFDKTKDDDQNTSMFKVEFLQLKNTKAWKKSTM